MKENKRTLLATFILYLGDDDVRKCSGQTEKLQRVLQIQRTVVLGVIFHTVIDVRDLTNVIAAILHAEVTLQFGPALQHELESLAVV